MKNILSYQSASLNLVSKRLNDEKNRYNRAIQSPVLATPEKLYRPFIERYVRVEQQLQRETSRLVRDKERILHKFKIDSSTITTKTNRSTSKICTNFDKSVEPSNHLTFEKNRQQFLGSIRTLEALNPLKIMDRGYSITYKEGKLVKTVADVEEGDSYYL